MERFSDARGFKGYRMNLDAAPEALEPNEVRVIMNMLEENNSGKITNMKGFTSITSLPINSTFTFPSGTFKCVGSKRDIEENTIIYCMCDTVGTNHSILQMNTETKVLEWILMSQPYLNFKTDYRVRVSVIEGLMYFTDGYFGSFLNNDFNPPRKINIAKAIKFTQRYNSGTKDTVTAIGNATLWPRTVPIYKNVDGQPYTAYKITSVSKFKFGGKVVPWIYEGDAYGYRFKSATGYSRVIDVFTYSNQHYIVTDRIWTGESMPDSDIAIINPPIANTNLVKTGHILPYAADMYFGIDWQVLDVIKWPPESAPSASYNNDTEQSVNKLRNNLFQFRYRWGYDDHEKSVFSPISEVPLPSISESLNGSYNDLVISDNVINVWTDTGSMDVQVVELVMRRGNIGNWILVNRQYKYDQNDNCLFQPDIYTLYQFYNNEAGGPLDQEDTERLYDFVPIVALQQEIIEKNRLIFGDYTEGYDNLEIDVDLSVLPDNVTPGDIAGQLSSLFLPQSAEFTDTVTGSIATDFLMYIPVGDTLVTPGLSVISNPTNFEEGYTYVYTIDAYPYVNYTVSGSQVIPPPWAGTHIRGYAVVSTFIGMTRQQFKDAIISQLRYMALGNSVNSVLAVDPLGGTPYNTFGSVTIDYGYGVLQYLGPSLYPYYFAFFIPSSIQYSAVNISVTKIRGLDKFQTFKAGDTHKFGLIYKDRAGRVGAVNTSLDGSIYIPTQMESSGSNVFKNNINWSVNHRPPDWATQYSWVYNKGSDLSYYIQLPVAKIGREGLVDAVFIDVNSGFINSLETNKKLNIGMYSWERGDRLRFTQKRNSSGEWEYFNGLIDVEILGTFFPSTESEIYTKDNAGVYILDADGNKIPSERFEYLMVQQFNYESYGIEKNNCTVEIYRPRKKEEDSVYYQFGDWLDIIDPHTAGRRHSGGGSAGNTNQSGIVPATGIFTAGNAYISYRVLFCAFPCESNWYSDFYDSDVTSIGTPNIANRDIFLQQYISKIIYSSRLIQNTRVNGMSAFISSDSVDLQDKYGPITHMQEVGSSLKILQKSKPSSIMIGRAGVTQPTEAGTEIISSTKDVLGTLYVHNSDFGTVHSDSYVKVENRGYFFDFYAKAICRDASNGIQNISEAYNINAFIQEKCRLFGSADNVDVIGAYDQANEIVYWTFTDKTTSANSFTIGFHDTKGRNQDGFVLFTHFLPDFYGTAKETLTSFKGKTLWLHNSDTALRANFYGVQYKYWFTVVFNKLPLTIKRWLSIFVSSDKVMSAPNAGDINIPATGNNPSGMVSLLKSGAFSTVEGKWVAELGKNMTTNQNTAEIADLVNGDDLEGQTIEMRLEGDYTTEHKILSVEVEGVTSKI